MADLREKDGKEKEGEKEGDGYDFIIVGSGPSGLSLLSSLVHLLPSSSILLLEAGTSHSEQVVFDRYSAFRDLPTRTATGEVERKGWNWGYKTVPQKELDDGNGGDGVEVDYSRGKGLGGTSLINFLLWNRGPSADWTRLSHLTSPSFSWPSISTLFSSIENVHIPSYPPSASASRSRYVHIDTAAHGTTGAVDIEYAQKWEKHIQPLLEAAEQFGWTINTDLNSGDPIGVGLCPSTAKDGVRVTARSAYLDALAGKGKGNVEIKTGWRVARVLVEGGRAVGVEGVDGKKLFAKKEVILSAGALDTPKILLLSGIGPREDLEKVGVDVVRDLPGVGRNLQDHCHFPITAYLKPGVRAPNKIPPGSEALAEARAQFARDGSGELSYVNGSYILGFLNEPSIYDTEEFKALDIETQTHLKQPTVPTWELGTGLPLLGPPPPGPPREFMVSIGVLMNPQSRGTVTLKSSDPREDALFDPRLMTHPYDRRVLVTAGKRIMEFMESPAIAETVEKPLNMPESDSEEHVLAFVRKNLRSTWHMSGTCKIGAEGDEMAVVNSDFAVRGVEGLRVVDLSVLPVLLNAHPVGAAYVIGKMAGSIIGKQYQV